jgi:tetratricopeptide (TPR) repeat protein
MNEESGAKNIGVGISGGQTAVGGDMVGGNKYVYEAPPPVIAALHQLPPPPADFTGRTTELRELRAAIEKGGIHISGLQGQGGVGKTALALKLAAELAPNYPDAQIYLDLKGVTEKPLTAAEAMSHVLRTFHPEAKLPEKEEDLRAQYLSVLHNKRALLLMDNAKDAAQLRLLIPPEACTFLVTSREHFTLPGLHRKNLNTLPPQDAKDLLLQIESRIGAEAEAISELCGYLPLALRLAAAALAEREDISPTDYRKRLANEKLKLLAGRDESVEASITLSYNLLDTEMQKRWRMLAVFPDTFDASAAAAVWETDTDTAQDTLSRLLQYSMLEWTEPSQRYHLHDLMRDFGRKRLTPAESDGTALRHAKCYLDALRGAHLLYEKGGESVTHALALFDLERGNIQTGQIWTATHSEMDQDAAKQCSDYPDQGTHVLLLRQHPREQIRWREAARAAASRLKDRAAEGRHLGNLGIAHYLLGEYRRAIEYHNKHLAIARELHDPKGEGQALGNLGLAHYSLGDYRRAIEHQEARLVIARDIGDRQGEGAALGNLGSAYEAMGNHRGAIEHHEKHLAIARELHDRQGEGQALGNLGLAHYSLGDYNRAIEHHEKHLTVAREFGDRQNEGRALGNLGITYHLLGEYRRAIEYHDKHLAIARDIGDRQGEGAALGNLGSAYDATGETRRAVEYYEQQLAITRDIGDRLGEGNALGGLGNAYSNLGETNRAVEYYGEQLAITHDIGDRKGEGNTRWNMSLALDKLNDRGKATEHAEVALKIYEQIEDPRAEQVRKQLDLWRNG